MEIWICFLLMEYFQYVILLFWVLGLWFVIFWLLKFPIFCSVWVYCFHCYTSVWILNIGVLKIMGLIDWAEKTSSAKNPNALLR